MNISLLSTIDSPILGYMVQAFVKEGVPIHSVLLDSKVFSEKDQKIFAGRTGGRMPAIPLATFEAKHIPCFFFSTHVSESCKDFIVKEKIDLLINAGTPRILPAAIIDAATKGVLNCHPGLLPHYRGCSCVEWALWNNDPVGNTVHFMTEKIDKGMILAKEETVRSVHDSYQDVRVNTYMQGFALMARTVQRLISGKLTEKDFVEGTEGTYWKPMPDETFEKLLERFVTS
jgi:methionyl-tRNA formyltransferase